METVSKIMYSIANFFTWVLVILSIVGIVLSSLAIANVFVTDFEFDFVGVGSLSYFIVILIVGLITIWMVRRAKDSNSSKAWDVLFIILGVLGSNIFYILGGIFGVIAPRRK